MKVFACVLLAVAAQAAPAPEADPALLYGAYAGLPYAGVYGYPYAAHAVVPAATVVTGNSVPVAVGGYKAVAGSNGDLAGPIHEVPGLIPALAVHKQESSGDVSLSTGTGALVASPVIAYHYGKREAEADPALLYGAYAGLPYAGVYGAGVYGTGVYGAGVYGYPYAAHALTYAVKPLTLKTDVTATNLPVPVAIGGYKAEAGNNGDLVGAVHEVPGLLPAPALLKQENSNGGALTVGTSAVVTHSFVKREAEAEAEADPALLYGAYGYGRGLGYAGYGYSGLGYAGYGGYAGYPHTYGAYAGYPYYG
jgi:hypothetical protein